MNEIINQIEERFGLKSKRQQRPGLEHIGIESNKVLPLLAWLKAETGYVQLVHLSAVDWLEENEFQLTWLVGKPEGNERLMIDTRIDRENPVMETASRLWPQAVTYEQEINEMFGISFPGSPRQGVEFILEGWQGPPPMRRDFDTKEFVDKNIPARGGRHNMDPRTYIGEKVGEKGYLHD